MVAYFVTPNQVMLSFEGPGFQKQLIQMNTDGSTAQRAGDVQPDCPSHPHGNSNNQKINPKDSCWSEFKNYAI